MIDLKRKLIRKLFVKYLKRKGFNFVGMHNRLDINFLFNYRPNVGV